MMNDGNDSLDSCSKEPLISLYTARGTMSCYYCAYYSKVTAWILCTVVGHRAEAGRF